jgi:CopG family nickel-responsive transcriptional regulator
MSDELLGRIDAFAENHGYTSRSEVVREASRDLRASSRTANSKNAN